MSTREERLGEAAPKLGPLGENPFSEIAQEYLAMPSKEQKGIGYALLAVAHELGQARG